MKTILVIFIFCFSLISKSQTPTDSLSVTPNPFSKRTVAYYNITQNDTVSLLVFNIIGQTILSLKTNSIMPSGLYQDSLIMDSYSDGIYFVQLKLGSRKSLMKKIAKSVGAGVNELNLDNETKIYPNPVSNTLYIFTEQNEFENSEIEITNTLGKTVLKLPYSNTIDLSNLSQGYYNLKIVSQNKHPYYSKFIKE